MKAIIKSSLTALSLVALIGVAHAAEDEAAAPAPASTGAGSEGVVGKVEKAVEHGVTVAADGVKKGVNWAAHGVEKGANAAAHGIEVGANATSRTAKKVASKVTGKGSAESSEPAKSEGANK